MLLLKCAYTIAVACSGLASEALQIEATVELVMDAAVDFGILLLNSTCGSVTDRELLSST